MTYGPTNEFSDKTIRNHTRGLFLDADVYKQWWLQTNMTQTYDGEMVKIAVVLWDQDEALAKRIKLPDFWTEQNARILADHLQNLEMPIWDLEFEEGCRTIIKMQEQVLESRIEAANAMKGDWKIERKQLLAENDALKKDKAKLKAQLDAIAAALEEGDMTEAARLVAAAKKQDKGKGKGKEAAVGNEEDADADEDVETEEREDPYDEDYED
jgi:regulator of replication initiation timing